GIGGYAEGILQRLQGERTFSPSPGNSLFPTSPHRLRLAFAALNARVTTSGSTGSRAGTARPFPLWRLLSCPHSPPVDPITREWYCPQARIPGLLTFRPLGRFRPSCGFDHHCSGVWCVCHIPPGKLPKNWQNANASMTNALEHTRRETLLLGAAALVSSLAQNVEAGQDTERHGISAFGDLKYPPDFKHFDYVNPNAPKGGVFSHIGATRAFNQNF